VFIQISKRGFWAAFPTAERMQGFPDEPTRTSARVEAAPGSGASWRSGRNPEAAERDRARRAGRARDGTARGRTGPRRLAPLSVARRGKLKLPAAWRAKLSRSH
ncbi:hypothetical protein BN1183_CH_00010, partial [Pantoea ananatis]